MAEINSYPNNSDEYIGAEEVMRWHHGRTKGVFAGDGNAAVTAVAGEMQVQVAAGIGWMTDADGDGICWWFDSPITLLVDAAESTGTMNRIDRVIVEWKTTDYADLPEVKILKGQNRSVAQAPALTNTSSLRQISLARISIPAGTTALTNVLITDERQDTTVCGIVTETVTADTSVINTQYEEALDELRTAIAQAWDGNISDGAITTAKIEDEAVTTAKIDDGAVTSDKLASAVSSAISGKVDKSGDTMTGDLTTSDCAVFVKSSEITDGTTVSALSWGQRFGILDSAGNTVGLVHPSFATDGRQGICLRERRQVSGSSQDAWLTIYLNSSGTETISVSSPSAWRSALSFGNSSLDTTTKSATISNNVFGTVCSLGITSSGWYLVTADVQFDTSTTGVRILIISDESTATTNTAANSVLGSGRATLNKAVIYSLQANSTLYLRAYQNSGSSMSVTGRIRAFKIG